MEVTAKNSRDSRASMEVRAKNSRGENTRGREKARGRGDFLTPH
jgi:hypothetical protein